MALAQSSVSQAELAICRLVVETSGFETVEFLGCGCLARFDSVQFLHSQLGRPRSNYFLVASNQVLAKCHLRPIVNQEMEKRNPSVKIVVEFLRKDRTSLERKPLSKLYRSFDDDVFELSGVIYVALTNLDGRLIKSSLLSRSLEAFSLTEGTVSSLLASDQLQCCVFCGEKARQQRNSMFSTRLYDLVQCDNGDRSRFPNYCLRDQEEKRFFKEDELIKEGGKPLGSVIVNRDFQLVGFLHFVNKHPEAVLVGTTVLESGAKCCETVQCGDVETELNMGATGDVYPLLDPVQVSKSQVEAEYIDKTAIKNNAETTATTPSAPSEEIAFVFGCHNDPGASRGDKSDQVKQPFVHGNYLSEGSIVKEMQEVKGQGRYPTENTYRSIGPKETLLNLPANYGEFLQHGAITQVELPLGASGGEYPLYDPGMQPESQVKVHDNNKTTKDNASPQAGTTFKPEEKFAALELKETVESRGDQTDQAEAVPQQPLVNGGSCKKELKEEKDQAHCPTENNCCSSIDLKGMMVNLPPKYDCATNGDHSENLYKSFKGMVVDLPPESEKEALAAPSSRVIPPGELKSCQPAVHNGALLQDANTKPPAERSRDHGVLSKSHSCPSDLAKNEEFPRVKRSTSELLPRLLEEKQKFYPSDPLAKTILGCLGLLEGLCRCLDKEYKYGTSKCWKHIAEAFGIKEQDYQNFKCSQFHSPTEIMFEYLKTCSPDVTVSHVKDGLSSIERQDVIAVFVKYERFYRTLNDETLMCSLFDSHPDIIGEIAFLLDMQKAGLKNWEHLAAKLDIPRRDFKSFETFSADNPAEGLFELIKIRFPRSTIGELIGHLEAMKRFDVVNAIKESAEVTECSLISELMEDLDVTYRVCELLNQQLRTSKVLGWKHLGKRFGLNKNTLDDLSPTQEEIISPTEALIRHLGGAMPWLSIADFIWALHNKDRNDALAVIDVYLPDGCIPNILKSCVCQRCQMSRQEENTRLQ